MRSEGTSHLEGKLRFLTKLQIYLFQDILKSHMVANRSAVENCRFHYFIHGTDLRYTDSGCVHVSGLVAGCQLSFELVFTHGRWRDKEADLDY